MSNENSENGDGFSLGANGGVTRIEILRALSWAAPLTSRQLWRMVAPAMHLTNFRDRMLAPLAKNDLIRGEYYYTVRPKSQGRMPVRQGLAWALTASGFAQIASDDKAPAQTALMRGGKVLAHDLMIGEVVTRIIEWTRPILSSMYIEHEDRLDEARRRPISDALVVVRYDPTRILPGIIPWKSLPPAPGEGVRFYAIEIDRGTEEYGITDAKARNYFSVRNDPTFYERYGRMFPIVLITVPTVSRKERWHAGWKANWPGGKWMIATETEVAQDAWLEYAAGAERTRTFVDGWQPGQDQIRDPKKPTPQDVRAKYQNLPATVQQFIEENLKLGGG